MKHIHVIIISVFSIIFSVSAQQIPVDGIAAIVGDRIVLMSDVNNMVIQYSLQQRIDISKNPQLYNQLSKQFLQNLIDEKLLLIQAEEDTIEADEDITRKEVEAFYQQFRDSLPRVEASVDISHILMEVKPSETSAQKALEKIKKIKEMLDKIKTGRNFGYCPHPVWLSYYPAPGTAGGTDSCAAYFDSIATYPGR